LILARKPPHKSNLCLQVLGDLNVRFEFGAGKRPEGGQVQQVECLIKVYTTKSIKKGAELLSTYGEKYWTEAAMKERVGGGGAQE
jgi:hypothetical protein